jgi:hypothetical protein
MPYSMRKLTVVFDVRRVQLTIAITRTKLYNKFVTITTTVAGNRRQSGSNYRRNLAQKNGGPVWKRSGARYVRWRVLEVRTVKVGKRKCW